MSSDAQNKIRDMIVEMMGKGVRTQVITPIEAMVACFDSCAAIIATMIPPENHIEATNVVIEKLPRHVAHHAALVADIRKAMAN